MSYRKFSTSCKIMPWYRWKWETFKIPKKSQPFKLVAVMLKEPKPRKGFSKVFYGIVAAEALVLVVTYWQFHQLNTRQRYRYEMYKKFPTILNWYYKTGEKLGGLDTRQTDLEYFNMRLGRDQK